MLAAADELVDARKLTPATSAALHHSLVPAGDRRTHRAGRPVRGVSMISWATASGAAARIGSPAMGGIDKLNLLSPAAGIAKRGAHRTARTTATPQT